MRLRPNTEGNIGAEVKSVAIAKLQRDTRSVRPPSFQMASRVWLQIGLLGFGGPVGQIALMHRALVEQRRWVSEADFQHALSFCVLLPGPEAQQLATYLGWQLHGVRGGIVAGTLFWIPGALLLWSLSWLYVSHRTQPDIAAVFGGLKAAVVAIVFAALVRMGRKTLTDPKGWLIASLAFIGMGLGVWFPVVIFTAGSLGIWLGPQPPPEPATTRSHAIRFESRKTFRTILIWLAVWWIPLLLLGGVLGWTHVGFQLGLFFSQAAMVTFGGAYAVLPYVAEHAQAAGWATRSELLDGLALGETTPGPLVLVLQWIGFMAGWKNSAPLPPLAGATVGAVVTSWATFAPSFLWIFAWAPFVERLRASPVLARFLRGVSAAVIGLIATLAVKLLGPVWFPTGNLAAPNYGAIGLTLLSFAALSWRRWPVALVILGCGAVGWLTERMVLL